MHISWFSASEQVKIKGRGNGLPVELRFRVYEARLLVGPVPPPTHTQDNNSRIERQEVDSKPLIGCCEVFSGAQGVGLKGVIWTSIDYIT